MSAEDDTLKQAIINILSGPEVMKIVPFFIKSQLIASNHFAAVCRHLKEGNLKVKHYSAKPGMAYYEAETDTFYVDGNGIDAWRKALIVHEAIHAINDIARINMDIATSEALSYVAQAQYLRGCLGSVRQLVSSNAKMDKLFELAWSLATTLQIGKTPTEAEYDALRVAINESPEYLGTGASMTNFDGVIFAN